MPESKDNKTCDHTSVGMIVWKADKILLIERKRPPFGFAPPSGHVDDDVSFERAASRELEEETGLKALKLNILAEEYLQNTCRRIGGTWHLWKVYQVEAQGEIKRSFTETKQAGWFSIQEVYQLAQRTRTYLSGNITKEEWQASPGLEVIWYEWFNKLAIV